MREPRHESRERPALASQACGEPEKGAGARRQLKQHCDGEDGEQREAAQVLEAHEK